MKQYALRNGIILDGTRDMEPVFGKTILVKDRKIEDIVDDDTDVRDRKSTRLNSSHL